MNTNHSSYQQQKFSVTNIGSVTLMMIFIVLCMVTFAALSLSSASYDWRSAKKSADHTTAYYQTSNQAETILSDIDPYQLQFVRALAQLVLAAVALDLIYLPSVSLPLSV